MVVPALDAFVHPGLTFHFVSNVDGHDIAPVLRGLKPAETLFVIASKTFTTQETLANADVAKAWFQANGGTDIAKHFVATTTNVRRPPPSSASPRTFGFWDWVGGRYSLWSAIGLPIALAVGGDHFRALLAGAHAMDRHFAQRSAGEEPAGGAGPARRLVPQLPRFHEPQRWRRTTRACAGSRRTCSSSEMESNGKGVDLDGELLPLRAPVRSSGANPAPTASTRTSRCCTRAPT